MVGRKVMKFLQHTRHSLIMSHDAAFLNHVFPSGSSVSLSGNGSMLAVGGPFDNSIVGATWVFQFDGFKYNQLGSKLVGTGYKNDSSQGKGGGQGMKRESHEASNA